MTILSPSCADFLEICEPEPALTLSPLLIRNGIVLPLPLDRTIKTIHISILYGSVWIGLRLHCYSIYRRVCLREERASEF
jgi:hypothetical protein